MIGLIVVVFYLEYYFVWTKIWNLSFKRFKERVNPAFFTVKSRVSTEMWEEACSNYDPYSGMSEATHFLYELKKQLKRALKERGGLTDEDKCEIVTMVCELENDHLRIDLLEKRAKFLNQH